MKALKKREWVHDAHAQPEREKVKILNLMWVFVCFSVPFRSFGDYPIRWFFCMCFHPQTVGVWGDDPILTIYILVGVETQ